MQTITQATKTVDEIFRWRGFGYPHEQRQQDCGWESVCWIRVYQRDGSAIVLASDLDDDVTYPDGTGTSITNSAENMMRLVVERYGLDPAHLTFIEHYPLSTLPSSKEDQFSLVECE